MTRHSAIDNLIEEIQAETRFTSETTGFSAIAPEILKAMRDTPREAFVPDDLKRHAYENHPLPVGFGQTISQPFIVAIMSQMLMPRPEHRVLEIGAGSGYQAAVLAHLVHHVISIEIIPTLAASAAQHLRDLAIANVEIHCADGNGGWAAHAPYDGIMVTACASHIPGALIEQLKPGGRMIIPVGQPFGYQDLQLVRKSVDGIISTHAVLPVAFVPLTHGAVPTPNAGRHNEKKT